jgi:hypothetical protein
MDLMDHAWMASDRLRDRGRERNPQRVPTRSVGKGRRQKNNDEATATCDVHLRC